MTFLKLTGFVAAVVASITFAGAAYADAASAKAAVDAAKAAGTVGEQADGFLGFVNAGAASPDARAAVAEINAGRRQLYAQAAAKNGVTPAAAGASAFKTVVQSLIKPGEYYQNTSGALGPEVGLGYPARRPGRGIAGLARRPRSASGRRPGTAAFGAIPQPHHRPLVLLHPAPGRAVDIDDQQQRHGQQEQHEDRRDNRPRRPVKT